jgi:hypothetical protein
MVDRRGANVDRIAVVPGVQWCLLIVHRCGKLVAAPVPPLVPVTVLVPTELAIVLSSIARQIFTYSHALIIMQVCLLRIQLLDNEFTII